MKTALKPPKGQTTARVRNAAPLVAPPAPTGSVSLVRLLRSANRWREQYNPLIGLNLVRARFLIESYTRGDMADLMWTMGAPFMGIETADPDLLALIERRMSAIEELDWNIKVPAKETAKADFDEKLAEEQQAALREAYDGIDNLAESFGAMAMPTFRGFAHLEKWLNADGDITHLEIVDQWNVVRDGLRGDWKYNPDALMTSFAALPAANLMDPARFLFREVARPVNRFALVKFVRANLCEKDWDAFVEIYGIPGGVIVGPPNVPQGKEGEYEAAAGQIAEGGRGYIPNGSEWIPNDAPRGNNPFEQRQNFLSKQLILAGTGGTLTMWAESGTGTLAGNAHQETFNMLARADARRINAVYQRGIDFDVLTRNFPGKAHLAYFELAAKEETDIGEIVEHAVKLAQAGYSIDATELSEHTGYNLTERAPTNIEVSRADQGNPPARATYAQNRRRSRTRVRNSGGLDAFMKNCQDTLDAADALSFKEPLARLEEIKAANHPDLASFRMAVRKLIADLPAMAKDAGASPAQQGAWAKVLGATAANGIVGPVATAKNSFDPDEPRDQSGKWSGDGDEVTEADLEESGASNKPSLSESEQGFIDNFDAKDPSTWSDETGNKSAGLSLDDSNRATELKDSIDAFDKTDYSTFREDLSTKAEDLDDKASSVDPEDINTFPEHLRVQAADLKKTWDATPESDNQTLDAIAKKQDGLSDEATTHFEKERDKVGREAAKANRENVREYTELRKRAKAAHAEIAARDNGKRDE